MNGGSTNRAHLISISFVLTWTKKKQWENHLRSRRYVSFINTNIYTILWTVVCNGMAFGIQRFNDSTPSIYWIGLGNPGYIAMFGHWLIENNEEKWNFLRIFGADLLVLYFCSASCRFFVLTLERFWLPVGKTNFWEWKERYIGKAGNFVICFMLRHYYFSCNQPICCYKYLKIKDLMQNLYVSNERFNVLFY